MHEKIYEVLRAMLPEAIEFSSKVCLPLQPAMAVLLITELNCLRYSESPCLFGRIGNLQGNM